MERVGDAFVWPFRDPKWLEKVTIIGLISLIPIIGTINGLGWMLASIDRLREGKQELPPGNFDHLGRGVLLFVVFLVYALALLVVGGGVFILGFVLLAAGGQGNGNAALEFVGVVVTLLALGVILVVTLAFFFARPAVVPSPDAHDADQHPDRRPYASGRRFHKPARVICVRGRSHRHHPVRAGDRGLDHPELRGGSRCRTFRPRRRPRAVTSHRRRLLRLLLQAVGTPPRHRHRRLAAATAQAATCRRLLAATCLRAPATRSSARTAS